jgi:tRNA isopentenyl-2-thiomethyl-A-37 hydroxylase MiaE
MREEEQMAKNEIRQVLMNEMGLTREMIRMETLEIVKTTVDKFLQSLLESGRLADLLIAAANKEMRSHDRYARSLSSYVEEGAARAAREWIKAHLEIRGL